MIAETQAFIIDMAAMYSWADIVICRAGALTIAELSATFGQRHPSLAGERDKLAELSSQIEVKKGELAKARRAEVELGALEAESGGKKKVLDSFETRSREMSEIGRVDPAYFRIVANARPPAMQDTPRQISKAAIMLTILGGMLGALLAMFGYVAAALSKSFQAAPRPKPRVRPLNPRRR